VAAAAALAAAAVDLLLRAFHVAHLAAFRNPRVLRTVEKERVFSSSSPGTCSSVERAGRRWPITRRRPPLRVQSELTLPPLKANRPLEDMSPSLKRLGYLHSSLSNSEILSAMLPPPLLRSLPPLLPRPPGVVSAAGGADVVTGK
jgi:hypothetical protein